MKWRPEVLSYKRKKVLMLSQENFVKHVYKQTKGEWKLSLARLQKLESKKNHNTMHATVEELGLLFKILRANPNEFWE